MEKDILATREKLYQMLEPSGWAVPLRTFIKSDDFLVILNSLYEQSIDGKKFTPKLSQVFKAFMECPYDKLKVVMIGQDPYPQLGIADGIAFSCSVEKDYKQPSLAQMFGELKRTVYKDQPYEENGDLVRWSNQGVLLINTALTTSIGTPGTHQLLWRPFIGFLLDHLVWTGSRKVYAFLGKKAQDFMDIVPDNNLKIAVTHPASASYSDTIWDGKDIFLRINEYCETEFNTKIIW